MATPQLYYRQTIEETLAALQTSAQGLTKEEVKRRIAQYGRNAIQVKKKYKTLIAIAKQFKDLIIIVLALSAALALYFREYETGIVLVLIVLINAVIGFFQEFQAEKIIAKLSSLINPKTIVVREEQEQEVDSGELVPGDIVLLNEGDSITADLRVLESRRLQVNSFSITGESNPQFKGQAPLTEDVELARQTNMIFTGSTVAVGNGKGVVVATGMNSEFGKIAALSQETKEEASPLQEEINNITKRAVILSVIVGGGMLFVGLAIYHITVLEAVIFAIGIGNAMVPQGLPAEVNVALALGAKRLAQKNAVVRKLSSVETLGATTFICSDKTGTITKNEMTVEYVWIPGKTFTVTGIGYEGTGQILPEDKKPLTQEQEKILRQFLETGFFSSNAKIAPPDTNHPTYYVLGDPTEGAILALCKKGNIDTKQEDKKHGEMEELPFDASRKMMSSIRDFRGETIVFAKGAPSVLLEKSTVVRDIDGNEKTLTESDRKEIQQKVDAYANQAYRVLAFAYRKMPKEKTYTVENTEKEFTFMGCVAIMDPPREGVREAIEATHKAHVKTVIITGDAQQTALAIAKKIDPDADQKTIFCATGSEVDRLDDETIFAKLQEYHAAIFARVSPGQKLRIVQLLKEHMEVVAVTGDGVNDAPALKKAHIGVAMGKIGTEVAKEAAQIVLADDSFATLVVAIREGRVIYANLTKTITTVFATNFGEFFTIVFGLMGTGFLGAPISLLAIQILLIDLVAEILPLMALTYDKPMLDVMTEKPRNVQKHMLSLGALADIIITGLLMGTAAYGAFLIFLQLSGVPFAALESNTDLHREAMTVTYVTIVFATWGNVLLRRQGIKTILTKYTLTNKALWGSLVISLGLVLTIIYAPVVHEYTKMGPLQLQSWFIVGACAAAFIAVVEFKKLLQRKYIPRLWVARSANTSSKAPAS